jgi:uncharacterized Zn finger protein
MKRVTAPDEGLFPSPSEIRCTCTCPDDASLCTHSAAVLYAVSIKLDQDPALLFTLRKVRAEDMLQSSLADTVSELISDKTDDIPREDLQALFGIELK